ncbi:hypothetical protein H6P81_005086 [Aristolochia fimbriata]|uniref:Uncharacterized protein n=1 Tax=Aristolochia fimbriata TaxID=158543 RepID=A0AAV7ETK8_ARIFI|nr:hypothetical protein H6P81_005086 [Aristolochia fimbriata]
MYMHTYVLPQPRPLYLIREEHSCEVLNEREEEAKKVQELPSSHEKETCQWTYDSVTSGRTIWAVVGAEMGLESDRGVKSRASRSWGRFIGRPVFRVKMALPAAEPQVGVGCGRETRCMLLPPTCLL